MGKTKFLLPILVVAIVTLMSAVFIVDEREKVLILQFGRVVSVQEKPGLAFKIPGRIGDSPLIGCGLYCDNGVGSAGATGRGEAAILSGGSWLIVERMRAGDTPEEACLHALHRVAEQAERGARWQPALWKDGRPNFGLTFYAVRKDGLYGSATMRGGASFAIADQKGARKEACAVAFQ